MRICHSADDLAEVFPNTIKVIFSILGHASIGSDTGSLPVSAVNLY